MADKEKLQPEINIGMVGHVDHGKTTLVKALSGIWTDTHSEEIKRGITIRLGYADAIFYKCEKCKKYVVNAKCDCGGKAKLIRKVSFVDAPGHESLMATMLSGATIMDGSILLIAANETCPQPQTREHLMALKISGIKNVVVVQNKIDTVSKGDAIKNHKEIKAFLKGTDYEKSPIIPISAQQNINVDVLIETIEKIIPTPKRDPKANPLMFVARSFDINKPGSAPEKLVGGVLGGALKQGILKVGEKIEIKPGLVVEEKNQKKYIPIETIITDLKTGGKSVSEVGPGGSIGVMTALDNAIVKSDSLAGSVVGLHGKLPPVLNELDLEVHLLERVVGTEEDLKVEAIKMSEPLMLNVNSAATVGVVTELGKNKIKCVLKLPVCADKESKVTISRRIGNRFRLIGYGIIQ
ncbi:MAG: translation initiation factor IF-2 subunit gamma [Candidatus Woesearchaeota archaeon]